MTAKKTEKKVRRTWISDEVKLSFEHTSADELLKKVEELKDKGWKEVEVRKGHADTGRGFHYDGQPHRIIGKRIETLKEAKKRVHQREVGKKRMIMLRESKRKKEIAIMKGLAKKHGYEVTKVEYDGELEPIPERRKVTVSKKPSGLCR